MIYLGLAKKNNFFYKFVHTMFYLDQNIYAMAYINQKLVLWNIADLFYYFHSWLHIIWIKKYNWFTFTHFKIKFMLSLFSMLRNKKNLILARKTNVHSHRPCLKLSFLSVSTTHRIKADNTPFFKGSVCRKCRNPDSQFLSSMTALQTPCSHGIQGTLTKKRVYGGSSSVISSPMFLLCHLPSFGDTFWLGESLAQVVQRCSSLQSGMEISF